MARDLTGVVLKDKWRIDSLLGEGGVAAVYAATHRNGKRVAVKVLHPHLACIPDVRDRFLREGYVANRVEHPGAVGVLDDDVTDDGLVFFVMDLLDGESLEKRLSREGKLATEDVLAIADSLLDVLTAAHSKGIVHRDIKPENIYSLRDGGQRLLDFGIARLQEQTATKTATQSGAALGTPSYMPPEQARGRWETVDARSDLWAVGATMFTLLTGRCVHEAETVNETLLLAMSRAAPPLASVWPDAPTPIAAIIDRALAFEMGDRWPDASSMRQAVQRAMLTLTALPPTRAPMTSGPEPTIPTARVTPSGPRGTQLATSVSDQPGPGGLRAVPRRRAVVGASVGAGLGGVALVLLLIALGRGKGPAPPEGTGLAAPPPATATAVATTIPLPSVALAPEAPPVAASASVELDVSELPAVSATVAPAPPPTAAAATHRPRSVLQPWPTRPGANAPSATAAVAPTTALPTAAPRPAAPTPSAAPAPAPAPKPNCNPPYVIDAHGDRQYKPDCL